MSGIKPTSPFYRNGNYILQRASGNVGLGVTEPDTLLQLANMSWFSFKNYPGTGQINGLQCTVDDKLALGATLITGPQEAAVNSGQIILFDMPVDDTPSSGDVMSAGLGIDSDTCLEFGAEADGAGGATGHYVKLKGAIHKHRTDQGAADYNPSVLTDDYLIVVDNSAAARAVTISTEDVQSGSADDPRFFLIKDEENAAAANNITVSLESGTIDGAANFVINTDGNSVEIYVTGTNGFVC